MNPQEQTSKQLAAAVEIPQPAPQLASETVVDQLRALRPQIGEVPQLTPEQRRALRNVARTPNPVLLSQINVIGVVDVVAQAVGTPAADVRRMLDESNRWTAVEDELRAMLNGVAGANLIRRQQVALLAAQAFGIGEQLSRNPAHAGLVPHIQEIKRLKRVSRRKKKATETPQTPQQQPAPPASGTAPKV